MTDERKRNILIVDNDRFVTQLLSNGLTSAGYDCIVAYGGHEAFNIVKTFPIDVVLASLEMSKGNGWELLGRIRDLNPKFPSVILLTSRTDAERIPERELVEAGAAASISKNADLSDILSAVDLSILQQMEEKSYHERTTDRASTSLQAEVLVPGLDRFRLVDVVNLSNGGFGFTLRGALTQVGTVVTFRLHTRDRKLGSIEGFGVVRWTAKDASRPKDLLVGVQFINPDALTLQKVEKLLQVISSPSPKKAG
ncbi:MAG: response regulator [Bdellovibrionaceae bacterium]|nr:response regulator [Bdellovibrionales bacterium]MCB9254250.1 response regulator [Pseudobdellovibrionaceae bacterium]